VLTGRSDPEPYVTYKDGMERALSASARRIFNLAALAAAILCVAIVTIHAIALRGFEMGAAGVVIQSLRANLYDTVVVAADSLRIHLAPAVRPTRYALICQQPDLTEAENVAEEIMVRRQLAQQSGSAYNFMRRYIDLGYPHPVFILSNMGGWGAEFCAAKTYEQQECTCGGRYKAVERSRVPASKLFGPPETYR
jgi:hypothetical protein